MAVAPLAGEFGDVARVGEAGGEVAPRTVSLNVLNPEFTPAAAESEIPVGTNLTRNFGGESDIYGHSWTTEPVNVQSRNGLGLETENSAEFVAHGTVVNNAEITTQGASQWGRFAGGQQETLVPSPETQIQLDAVTMPDGPLPWDLPTDPYPLPGGN